MFKKSWEANRDRQITREIHKLFWRANWQHKWSLLGCLILAIPNFTLIYVLIPLATAYGVEAIVNRQFDLVNHYAIQILIYSVLFSITVAARTSFASYNGARAGVYLQQLVFKNYLEKDYEFYTHTYFGSLGSQATRLREAMNNDYNLLFTLMIPKQLVIVGGGIIVIASNSILLAVITIVMMAAVLSWTLFSGRYRIRYRRQVGEASSDVAGMIGDALTQATTVKSFANEDYETKRLMPTLLKWRDAQQKSWRSSIPSDMGRLMLAAFATALLLVVTANLYKNNEISIAMVTLVQLYVVRLVASTTEISEMVKQYEQAMGNAYQPVQTMLLEGQVQDSKTTGELPNTDKLDVSLNKVSYHYDSSKSGVEAVANFSLNIAEGEKIGLVGYSGSGKTTLTKLLMRFMDVSSGEIKVGGVDIRDIKQKDLRQVISYVPQEPALFHRTIIENISYGKPGAAKKAIQSAAKLAYIDEFVEDLPDGFDTMVGERGIKLSGGQRQRVAIARAILKDAPILVLDEATSALDSKSEQLIQKALWELMKDRTALVIAHRLSTIQRMDRIVVMDKGRIVQTGTHEELLKDKKGIYAELWAHQSGGYIGVPSLND